MPAVTAIRDVLRCAIVPLLCTLMTLPAAASTTEAIRARLADTAAPLRAGREPALSDLYAARGYAPLWSDAGAVENLMDGFARIEDDGLRPQAFRLADWPQAFVTAARGDDEARADFDLRMTRAYLRALQALAYGTLDPREFDPQWRTPTPPLAERVAPGLAGLFASLRTPQTAFVLARPPQDPYRGLQQALQRYRALQRAGGWEPLPEQPTLKPGDRNPAVRQLRARLAADGETITDLQSAQYDDALAEAVRRYQRALYLQDDGIVGGATRDALNTPLAARIDQLRVNLERARWLLRDLPGDYVLVDIAGYELTYHAGGKQTWRSRIVVGRPYRETPTLRSRIETIVLNPKWTVPETIFLKDIAPKARRDPRAALEAKHLRAIDAQGRDVPLRRIDWNDPKSVILRQDPGPENPLGRVKIEFPNAYQVYLHDTPSKALFDAEQRADSSGCIRVEHALDFAQRLLAADGNPAANDLEAQLADGRTRELKLRHPVAVILHYWTADLDADSRVRFKPDVYDRDAALLAALDR